MRKILAGFLVLFTLGYSFSSCTKSFDTGAAAIPNAANGWWVTYTLEDGSPIPGLTGHYFLNTYNTSENPTDSMWIDDLGKFWPVKGKANLNYSALTFSSDNSYNYTDTAGGNFAHFKVMNGKILTLGGLSTTGVPTDSLYFQLQFEDDSTPFGVTYVVQGTARTGFIDDDY